MFQPTLWRRAALGYWLVGATTVATVVALVWLWRQPTPLDEQPLSYWLWGSNKLESYPEAEQAYLLQGAVERQDGVPYFINQGMAPRLSDKAIVLVFRCETLDDDPRLINIMESIANHWEAQGATVVGIQLDYDSPTAQLLRYGDALENIRQHLDARYSLSITGLSDWILSGDRAALERVFTAADEVVFQLYGGSHYPYLAEYIEGLAKLKHRFKVGLLFNHPANGDILDKLKKLPGFTGVIYFIA